MAPAAAAPRSNAALWIGLAVAVISIVAVAVIALRSKGNHGPADEPGAPTAGTGSQYGGPEEPMPHAEPASPPAYASSPASEPSPPPEAPPPEPTYGSPQPYAAPAAAPVPPPLPPPPPSAPAGPLNVADVTSSVHSRPATSAGRAVDYEPRNALDGDRSTGWQVSRGGVGEWVRLDFGRTVTLDRVGVVPGYDKWRDDQYGDRWPLNNRVAAVRIEWAGGQTSRRYADDRAMQWTDVPGERRTSWVKIVITEVYAGNHWNDTVISEIQCEGRP
jgi:hypothetical protein